MTKEYLKVPEAAEFLGITERATWQRMYRGQIPYRKMGKNVLICVAELRAVIAALPGVSAETAFMNMLSLQKGNEESAVVPAPSEEKAA